MSDLLTAAVAAYTERNKATPDEIICFNSSCTGDQISLYQDLFVKQSLEHLKGVYTDATISFSLVMINVKTNERFFGEKDGRPSNPPAGTLICTDVVSKDYDFYLISQGSNKGTAVPNHYKVVYSDSKIQEGLLQEIAFSQCFNYVNWTGSIKVPSIMQYAKKASTFGAEVLEEVEIPVSLNRYLYFVWVINRLDLLRLTNIKKCNKAKLLTRYSNFILFSDLLIGKWCIW